MPEIVALAGNSGSGKSTLATNLRERYPEKVSVLFLDDYQKKAENVPELKGMNNWDSPEAVDFERLEEDLKKLKSGEEIEVMSWVSEVNPDYEDTGERIPYRVEPREIVILEGYFALLKEEIRELCRTKIFLEIPIEKSLERREKPVNSREYREEILVPMAKKYVQPTKKHADHVIDSRRNSEQEVFQKAENIIFS